MKLRLKSLELNRTLIIKVPNSCSLQQLIDTLSHSLPFSSSSSSLHLSLNTKDEIRASSPHVSLHSLGVADHHLIFYSFNPAAFSSQTLAGDAPFTPAVEKHPTLGSAEVESDEAVVLSTDSEPSFLRRVPQNDLNDFKLLTLTVHRVVVEHGFLRIDKDSGTAISCFPSLDDSPSPFSSMMSLRYTLPQILVGGGSHSVNLKFQRLGQHFVNVCGGLSDDSGSNLHHVCLDKRKYVRPLELRLVNGESKGSEGKEVFEMLKMVKDRVALPLLIDLCEKGGLDLPPCLMKLPRELKGLILERVSGVDLAKVACTCSELRFLCSDNELWKKKYLKEFRKKKFGDSVFKDLFALSWQTQKKKNKCMQRIVLVGNMLNTQVKSLSQLLKK